MGYYLGLIGRQQVLRLVRAKNREEAKKILEIYSKNEWPESFASVMILDTVQRCMDQVVFEDEEDKFKGFPIN